MSARLIPRLRAVDLNLLGADGTPVDMVSPYTLQDRRSSAMDARGVSPEARRNRAILAEALTGAGFSNYPAEWWHWSYGDQAWALRTGQEFAIFGMIAPK